MHQLLTVRIQQVRNQIQYSNIVVSKNTSYLRIKWRKYDPRPTDGWGDGFRIPSVEATLIGQTLSNSFINSISRNRLKTIQLNTSYVHYTINIWNTSKIPIANIESSYQPNSRSIMANNEKKENIYVILIIFRVDAPWLYVCVYDVPWLIHTTHHFYIIPVQCSTQQSI